MRMAGERIDVALVVQEFSDEETWNGVPCAPGRDRGSNVPLATVQPVEVGVEVVGAAGHRGDVRLQPARC